MSLTLSLCHIEAKEVKTSKNKSGKSEMLNVGPYLKNIFRFFVRFWQMCYQNGYFISTHISFCDRVVFQDVMDWCRL